MMNKQKMDDIPPKIILLILSGICIVLLVITMLFSKSVPFLDDICSVVIVPMEKGVNSVGTWVQNKTEDIKDAKNLRTNNKKLQTKVDRLNQKVDSLETDQNELSNLRKLFKLSQKYEAYPKVGARIIATDNNNWYNTFTIDKGKNDGLKENMNVIAGNGLVGIVYKVGPNFAKVRSIIDDVSYVSAMFNTTADRCIVNGDLKNISNGYITVDHIDKDAKVNEGDELVTSNVSSKFLPGITIGYAHDIKVNSDNLTKSAKVTPVVDFKHLEDVLVITKLKVIGDNSDTVLKKINAQKNKTTESKNSSSKSDTTTTESTTTTQNKRSNE